MSNDIYYIYKITNLINKKIYIGFTSKSIEERFKEHKRQALSNYKKKYPLHKAMLKYGIENFSIEIVDTSDNYDYCLKELEPYYIKLFESTNKNIGYNIGTGGEGGDNYTNNPNLDVIKEKLSKSLKKFYENNPNPLSGRHLTEEHIQHIKDAKVGEKLKIKYNTPEYKELFRQLNLGEKNPMYGKHISEENKELYRKLFTGRKVSEETRKKMSDGITTEMREKARQQIIKYNKSDLCKKRTIERNKLRAYNNRKLLIKNNLSFFDEFFSLLNKNVFSSKLIKNIKNCPFNYDKLWSINKNIKEWYEIYMELKNDKC